MPTIDERVAFLEGKVEEHSRGFGELREMVVQLDQKLDRRIDALDQKVDRFRDELAGRIDALDQKVDRRFESVDRRFETVDLKIDALDQKMSRQFLWIVGVQVAVLLSVVGALVSS